MIRALFNKKGNKQREKKLVFFVLFLATPFSPPLSSSSCQSFRFSFFSDSSNDERKGRWMYI